MKVSDLLPGDLVYGGGMTGVFITRTQHPRYPGLQLVIWRIPADPMKGSQWSFDALLPDQEVGEVEPSSLVQRARRLIEVLEPLW